MCSPTLVEPTKVTPLIVGVLEEDLGFVAAGRDDVEHAGGQPGLVPQLGDAQRALRREAGRLQHQRVAGDDADRRHPALRNHRREVPRRDAGEDADRLVVANGVVARRNVGERIALHDVRRAAGELDHLDDLEDVALRLVPLLAVLLRAEIGQLVEMAVEQGLHPEQHLDPLADRRVAPGGKGLGRSLDGLLDLVGGALRRERDHRAGRWIEARHVFLARGFLPLAADAVLQFSRPLAADGIRLPSRSGGKIVVKHNPLLVFQVLSRRGGLTASAASCRLPLRQMRSSDGAVVRPSR